MSGAAQGTDLQAGLETLQGLVLERLIEILRDGVPVQKPDAKSGKISEIGRAPAPPAYLSAAIRFLKDQGALTAEPGAEDLAALLAEADGFDDEEED